MGEFLGMRAVKAVVTAVGDGLWGYNQSHLCLTVTVVLSGDARDYCVLV